MKKIISILFAIVLATTSVFAKGVYSGDVQLHLGYAIDNIEILNDDVLNTKTTAQTGLFDVDISTWHLFNLNKTISLGFFYNMDVGVGSTQSVKQHVGNNSISYSGDDLKLAMSVNSLFGPALGIKLGKALRFTIGLGLALNHAELIAVNNYLDEVLINGLTTTGFGFDINAKFVPNSVVSPVIGYRFAISGGTQGIQRKENDSESTTIVNYKSTSVLKNTFYAGISFNW